MHCTSTALVRSSVFAIKPRTATGTFDSRPINWISFRAGIATEICGCFVNNPIIMPVTSPFSFKTGLPLLPIPRFALMVITGRPGRNLTSPATCPELTNPTRGSCLNRPKPRIVTAAPIVGEDSWERGRGSAAAPLTANNAMSSFRSILNRRARRGEASAGHTVITRQASTTCALVNAKPELVTKNAVPLRTTRVGAGGAAVCASESTANTASSNPTANRSDTGDTPCASAIAKRRARLTTRKTMEIRPENAWFG